MDITEEKIILYYDTKKFIASELKKKEEELVNPNKSFFKEVETYVIDFIHTAYKNEVFDNVFKIYTFSHNNFDVLNAKFKKMYLDAKNNLHIIVESNRYYVAEEDYIFNGKISDFNYSYLNKIIEEKRHKEDEANLELSKLQEIKEFQEYLIYKEKFEGKDAVVPLRR